MKETLFAVECILDNLRRVFQVINEQSKKIERDTGITGPQLWALKIICQNEPISVKGIAAKMYLNPATVVGILDRIELKGLVSRKREKSDKRFVKVELTVAGKELIRNAPEIAQNRIVEGLGELSPTKLRYISEGLEQLVRLLDAQEIKPRPMLSLGTSIQPK